jgi:hypothetical protein
VLSTYTNSTSGASWNYTFWPSGDRYQKINNAGSTSKELYVPRFGDVVTDYTQAGAGSISLANSYAQGTGIDSKVTRIPASGGSSARRHYLGDLVGTISMTLTDAGASSETSVKDAWGNQVAGSTSGATGPWLSARATPRAGWCSSARACTTR